MNRIWLLAILGLGLLIIFGNWNRLFSEDEGAQPSPTTVAKERADYSLEDITLRDFGKSGLLRLQVHALRLDHYASDDRVELQQPRFTAYEDQKPLLVLSSDSAVSHNHPTVILMQGATQVVHHHPPFLRIDTRNLFIYPEDAVVESQLPTHIQARGLSLHSGNLLFHYGQGELQLAEGVKGEVEHEGGKSLFQGQSLLFHYQDQEAQSLLIEGAPAQVEYRSAQHPMLGRAKSIRYDFAAQVLILEGEAYVQQDGHEFHGETLRFDLKANRVVMGGEADTQAPIKLIIPAPNKRTKP